MFNKRQSPGLVVTSTPGRMQSNTPGNCSTPKQTKLRRVLAAFVAGKALNRFEAARELRDWCLHSTVSELEGKGVRIDRVPETVPGSYGPVHCKRYRLKNTSENIVFAQTLLDGAAPVLRDAQHQEVSTDL